MIDLLVETEVEYATFKDIDYSDARISGKDIAFSVFEHCAFSATHLEETKFEKTKFVDCAISNVFNEGARLIDVEFERCKIIGLRLYPCDQTVFDIRFKGCKLILCNFSDAKMKGAVFADCEIEESCFQNTYLRDSDFSGTRFRDTLFSKCDLGKSSFEDAMGYSIDPRDNKVDGCAFSVPAVFGLLDGFGIRIL